MAHRFNGARERLLQETEGKLRTLAVIVLLAFIAAIAYICYVHSSTWQM